MAAAPHGRRLANLRSRGQVMAEAVSCRGLGKKQATRAVCLELTSQTVLAVFCRSSAIAVCRALERNIALGIAAVLLLR